MSAIASPMRLAPRAGLAEARSLVRARGVGLAICCDLIGISARTASRLLREGRFPIPELPRLLCKRGSPHRFSTREIERYLDQASTADVLVRRSSTGRKAPRRHNNALHDMARIPPTAGLTHRRRSDTEANPKDQGTW